MIRLSYVAIRTEIVDDSTIVRRNNTLRNLREISIGSVTGTKPVGSQMHFETRPSQLSFSLACLSLFDWFDLIVMQKSHQSTMTPL
jgi:hypothetical protein